MHPSPTSMPTSMPTPMPTPTPTSTTPLPLLFANEPKAPSETQPRALSDSRPLSSLCKPSPCPQPHAITKAPAKANPLSFPIPIALAPQQQDSSCVCSQMHLQPHQPHHLRQLHPLKQCLPFLPRINRCSAAPQFLCNLVAFHSPSTTISSMHSWCMLMLMLMRSIGKRSFALSLVLALHQRLLGRFPQLR
ncbi:uncharacterized protein MONOS_14375 [Monocercomonoides exilis]|uniref:uncharacterized protein n=1 Tax=Monocercomonoides exilis TaxID=2049356 RepID=UPI00355A761C|nr:hypothetical protein MONOS_14375 [Monocercomonoides exilis]|eukprot:MONOS_14375.1-p1 / transcript=MONOS_14375.1 / gene=MONOS_14375 / organism=Monocercomonoides_exilis_PA203 / gene_product=unspecified product / transcript_product=unspecified product / location=Mono_scaffold00991:4586-5158(+) / protein_length=191 / sequence_SO=supercontig / SO=protein_coding / is_pseudo=false